MRKPPARSPVATAIAAAALLAAFAVATPAVAQQKAPPAAPFQKVSALVPLPDFIPGLGTLYVDPGTLPAGPFLAYDKAGALVSTMYMLPLATFEKHEGWAGLSAAKAPVDHVDVTYNAGHPGVAEPHYHVILWHVSPGAAAALAK